MFEKLKNTIGQIFPLDIQNLDEFTSGRKKIMPKVRNPPVTVQIYYELPKELLQVEGLFLNSLIDEKNTYDFSNKRLIPEGLFAQSISLLEEKIDSKEFSTYETTTCSHARILARTCLKFLRANRISTKEEPLRILNLFDKFSDLWVKNSTRIAVRGPQVNFSFTQSLVDLVKSVVLLLPTLQEGGERSTMVLAIAQKIIQKLLKKLGVDTGKLSYLEFKLFKALLQLEAKLLSAEDESIRQYYARVMNDVGADFDFHLVFALRIAVDHLELISPAVLTAPKPQETLVLESADKAEVSPILDAIAGVAHVDQHAASQAGSVQPQQSLKVNPVVAGILKVVHELKEEKEQMKEIKNKQKTDQSVPIGQLKGKAEHKGDGEKPSAESDSKSNKVPELLELIREFRDVKDTTSLSILAQPIQKCFGLTEVTPEIRKKLITFNFYLTQILSNLVKIDLALPGFVKNGLAYTILDFILQVCTKFDLEKDARLKSMVDKYAQIFRKVLAAGSEATIHHFGEENCPRELAVRGSGHEDFAHMFEVYDQDTLLPLMEFFRVVRKNCHMEFVSQAIKGYFSFKDASYQAFHDEEFTHWLNQQKEVSQPEFVWSNEYSRELSEVLERQTTSIIHSRKANYSFYIDDFKSVFLAHFTRVGDIFLEPLVMTEEYKVSDPVSLLKKVSYPNPACCRM